MKKLFRVVITSMLLLETAAVASATTIYFLPGDAYFRTTIGEEFLKRQRRRKPLTFDYRPTEYFFCGHAGTVQLQIADKEGKLRKQLWEAYQFIDRRHPKRGRFVQRYKSVESADGKSRSEKDGDPEFIESDELHVFIYNAEFDLEKHRLLHLYNENWKEESYGVHKEPNELIGTEDVVEESAKHVTDVVPLKVKRQGSPSEAAHLVPDGELQIIIVPVKAWLGPIANLKTPPRKMELPEIDEWIDNPGVDFPPDIYIIKSDGLYKRSLKNGTWTPEKKVTYKELQMPGPGIF